MIGLGVSSISDSWYGFAQNVKSLEEYQNLTSHGLLPIFRGHILNTEDEIIRRHILNLLCRYKTDFNQEENHLEAFNQIKLNLTEMQKDGLVELKSNKIEVTTKGRPYIRNICMAFDLKLHRKKPETRLFSMTV